MSYNREYYDSCGITAIMYSFSSDTMNARMGCIVTLGEYSNPLVFLEEVGELQNKDGMVILLPDDRIDEVSDWFKKKLRFHREEN